MLRVKVKGIRATSIDNFDHLSPWWSCLCIFLIILNQVLSTGPSRDVLRALPNMHDKHLELFLHKVP